MTRQKMLSCALALLILAAPLSGCSQSTAAGSGRFGGSVSSGSREGGGDSSREQIVGKVTSVIGNEVVLAVGTLNGGASGSGASFGRRSSASGTSSGAFSEAASDASPAAGTSSEAPDSSSSAAGEQRSAGTGSVSIALTGETQTLLIPVGLTLTQGGATGSFGARGGTGSQATGSANRSASGAQSGAGTQSASGGQAGFSGRAGGTGTSGSARSFTAGTASRTAAGGTAAGVAGRSLDFSSITVGMILRITGEKQDDGSLQITQVSILSRQAG